MSLVIKGSEGIFDDKTPREIASEIRRLLKRTKANATRDAEQLRHVQQLIARPLPVQPRRRRQPARLIPLREASFLGDVVTYQNIPQLANKLSIGDTIKERRENAKRALANVNAPKVIYDPVTGLFSQVSLKDRPLLIRQFTGVNNIRKEMRDQILTQPLYEYAPEDDPDHTMQIFDKSIPFKADDILIVRYKVQFRFIYSTANGTYKRGAVRHVSDVFHGIIGATTYLKHGFVMHNEDPEGEDGTEYVPFFNPTRLKHNASGDTVLAYAEAATQLPEIKQEDMGDLHKAIIKKITDDYDFPWYIIFDIVQIKTAGLGNHIFDLEKMKLRAFGYSNIKINIFNEVVDIAETDQNCVIAYLMHYYDKLDVIGYFKNIDTSDGIDTTQIIDFCKAHNIKCIAYDIEQNVIATFFPTINRKKHKSLIYIAHNNHIYPTNNKSLHALSPFQAIIGKDNTRSAGVKPKKKDCPTELSRLSQGKINRMFKELLAQKIIPSHIIIDSSGEIDEDSMNDLTIRTFAHDGIFYFVNDDYDDILKLLTAYGIQDKMTPYITRYNVMRLIEELYHIGGLYSFAPHLKDIKMQGFMYHTLNIPTPEEEKGFATMDKRKAYPYALSCLKFIQTLDTRICKVVEKPTDIINTWAYIARPHVCSILMHSTNYYDGEHLLFCKEQGLEFDLLYGFETITHNNPFLSLIDDYYGKTADIKFDDNEIAKSIPNIWIGKFEKGCGAVTSSQRLRKLCNRDEATKTPGMMLSYDDDLTLCFDNVEKADIFTRKPISFQIKNMARRVLYVKMQELNIANEDVVQVCVDSVTFVNRNNVTIPNSTSYKGWRADKYDRLRLSSYQRCNNNVLNIVSRPERSNVLYTAYAGHGKTYWIKNKLIPSIASNNKSYIVLSPSHSTIKEYRKDGLNCDVIQRYEHHELPKEEVIIIDEIGLCGKKENDTIYKLVVLGRQIYSLGDYNQLLPVKEEAHYNNKIYLDSVYKRKGTFKTNYRNDFTVAYYDELINQKINVIDEIKKHNTANPYDADMIVCYRNAVRDEMNAKIMKHKGIEFGDVGCKVMCKVNNFRDLDIYNNFEFTVTCKTESHITLDGEHEFTYKQFFGGTAEKPHFIPAYCRTIYNMQGDSCGSYHVPDADLKYFNNGRFAYTLISRLKTK